MGVAPPSGQNRIMIYGPKNDGTYIVEFRTAGGEALEISVPDHAQHQRGDRKFQPLEAVAEDAEADDQPQIGDVVADGQSAYEAEDKDIGGYDRLGKVEDLHQRADGEIADRAH